MKLAVTDFELMALRVKFQALGQRELDGFLHAFHLAHRHGAQRLDAVNHLPDQNFGRLSACRQAHSTLALEPGGLQLAGIVHHVGLGAQLGGELAQAVAVGAGRAADHDQDVHLRTQHLDRVLAVFR